MTEGLASSGPARVGDAAGNAAEDPVVDAWRGLLVAHSRLVPEVEADLRAAGQARAVRPSATRPAATVTAPRRSSAGIEVAVS